MKMNELTRAVAQVKLTQEFPGLLVSESYSTALTVAAKNIRIELKKAFPGVKFSVKTSRFSGGDSIRISWTDGPTTKQVDEISNKYKAGSFNGMEDIYKYNSSLFNEIFGDAKYVSTSRSHSDAAVVAAIEEVAKEWGAEPLTLESYRKGGAWSWRTASGHALDRELNVKLYETSRA